MAAYLAALSANADGLNVTDFADQIAELASRRQIIIACESASKAARVGDLNAIDIAGDMESCLLDIMKTSAPKRPVKIADLVNGVRSTAASTRESGKMPGFDTGIGALDEIAGLIMPGDLWAIIASQGEGKTSLATQIGMRAAQTRPVLMVELEMAGEQVAARELAAESGITVRAIHEGSYNKAEGDFLNQATLDLAKPDFWILDDPKLSVRQIRSHALAMKRTTGLGCLIIDHLRLIRSETRNIRDRWERQAEVTGDLKILAKELGIPVIILAQRTRTAQRRDDPTPMVDDADAPSLDQDCDTIIGLWRRETWLRRNKPHPNSKQEDVEKWEHEIGRCSETAEVIALKRRRGKAHVPRVIKWDGPRTRFSDLDANK